MRFAWSLFFLFNLSACGGGHDRDLEVVAPPVSQLEFVAGQLGGRGNADGLVGRFSHPVGIAVSDSGVVYVKDGNGGPIRTISPDGVVASLLTTAKDGFWFKQRAHDALKSSALGLDQTGNLYVVEEKGSCQIQRLRPDGSYSLFAGQTDCGYADGTREHAKFGHLDAIAIDRFGNIFVVDRENFVIRKIDSSGLVTTIAGQVGVSAKIDGDKLYASFIAPKNIAVNGNGDIYVSDGYADATIRKISPDGTVTTLPIKNQNGQSVSYLPYVGGMATDSHGNLFIMSENELLKITPDGHYQSVGGRGRIPNYDGYGDSVLFRAWAIGAGPNGEGVALPTLGRIAIDKLDNIYYADTFDSSIRKIRPDTWVSRFAGLPRPDFVAAMDGIGELGKFFGPDIGIDESYLDHELRYDLYPDAQGNIYVKGREWPVGRPVVRKVDRNGVVTTVDAVRGLDAWPDQVGSDGTKYYISEDRISRLKPNTQLYEPGAYANLAGSSSMFTREYKDSVDGKGDQAVFFTITASTIDAAGNLFVIDRDRLRVPLLPEPYENSPLPSERDKGGSIRKITADGVVTTVAGSLAEHGYVDGPGKLARFHVPTSIVADKRGNLWVADTYNHLIRKIDANGVVSTFAGTPLKPGSQDGTGLQASFNKPDLLIFDHQGNLLVADSGNCLIRKITPSGKVTTIAGKAGSRGVILGKLPASISAIYGMTIDDNNILYIFSERALLKIAL